MKKKLAALVLCLLMLIPLVVNAFIIMASAASSSEIADQIEELEKEYDVTVVTQNVDNLHERAGSTKIIHLHGELTKARSVKDEFTTYEIGYNDIHLGDKEYADGATITGAVEASNTASITGGSASRRVDR